MIYDNFPRNMEFRKDMKQAGAELGQAQLKPKLCLTSTKI